MTIQDLIAVIGYSIAVFELGFLFGRKGSNRSDSDS